MPRLGIGPLQHLPPLIMITIRTTAPSQLDEEEKTSNVYRRIPYWTEALQIQVRTGCKLKLSLTTPSSNDFAISAQTVPGANSHTHTLFSCHLRSHDLKTNNCTFRQVHYDPPCHTKLFIVMAMYNEDEKPPITRFEWRETITPRPFRSRVTPTTPLPRMSNEGFSAHKLLETGNDQVTPPSCTTTSPPPLRQSKQLKQVTTPFCIRHRCSITRNE